MNKKSRLLVISTALIFGPALAFSWGPEGHMTISDIAQSRLTPETKAAISDILGSDQMPLADISNYPDTLRYGPTDFGGLLSKPIAKDPATAPWHYINIPVQATLSQTPTNGELDQYPDCEKNASGPIAQMMQDSVQNCIQAQIKFAITRLETPRPVQQMGVSQQDFDQTVTLWKDRRIIALSYLVHLVGDEHQPMHTSEDNNDQGGNIEQVVFQGKLERLHELWDDLIDKTGWQSQTPEGANALAQKLLADLDTLPQNEVASWISGDVEATINNAIGESFNISKNTIYPDYYRLPKNQAGGPVTLPPEYQAEMQPIAHRRLQIAGVRLAHILNQINWDGTAPQVKKEQATSILARPQKHRTPLSSITSQGTDHQ